MPSKNSLLSDDQKASRAEYQRAYREANRERIAAQRRAFREANHERLSEEKRAYRQANSAKVDEGIKRWRENNKERVRETLRLYQETHRAEVSAQRKKYREANAEKVAAGIQRWLNDHPGAKLAYHRARRARKKGNGGIHTAEDIQLLLELQEGLCAYCGQYTADNYHVDHFVPLCRGGSNGPENLVIACPPCNMSKGDKTLEEWITGSSVASQSR